MSAEPAATAKLCTVCGIDCASRPRIKDQQGRYICKECFDKAKQTKQVLKNPPVAAAAAPAGATAAIPVDGDNSFLLDLGSKESTGLKGTKPCPECGRALPTSAILCIGCGYNLTTGKRVPVKVSKEKVKADKGSSSSSSNIMENGPLLFGILALIQPALGALAFIDASMVMVGMAVCVLLGLLVGAWCLIAAFQDSVVWGMLSFFIGFVGLIWVLFINEDARLKWVFGGQVIGFVLFFTVVGISGAALPKF